MSELPTGHKFWSTQPVIQDGQKPEHLGIIDQVTTVESVPKEPYPLPSGFSWSIIDTTELKQREELYNFLRVHYVTHPNNTFRFAYSKEFLDWAIHPPGWVADWHLGVRFGPKGILVGFISGVPYTIHVNENVMRIACIDFLCVHHQLRGKNLAPVLIKEVTRRINLTGIFQAIYTAGKRITQPYTTARYYHRLVNYKKLVDVDFTQLPIGAKMEKMVKTHLVPKNPHLPGFREMEEKDIPSVTAQLNEYQRKYTVGVQFTEEEVRHYLMPRKDIVGSYVIEDERTKAVTAFFSFYIVPSTVLGNHEYDSFVSAYFYYYFSRPSVLPDLSRAVMEMAVHEFGADVINCLNVCDNTDMLTQLRFVAGDGNLNYYLFNYAMEPIQPQKNGIVLL